MFFFGVIGNYMLLNMVSTTKDQLDLGCLPTWLAMSGGGRGETRCDEGACQASPSPCKWMTSTARDGFVPSMRYS
jgi:hypothetical protein